MSNSFWKNHICQKEKVQIFPTYSFDLIKKIVVRSVVRAYREARVVRQQIQAIGDVEDWLCI